MSRLAASLVSIAVIAACSVYLWQWSSARFAAQPPPPTTPATNVGPSGVAGNAGGGSAAGYASGYGSGSASGYGSGYASGYASGYGSGYASGRDAPPSATPRASVNDRGWANDVGRVFGIKRNYLEGVVPATTQPNDSEQP